MDVESFYRAVDGMAVRVGTYSDWPKHPPLLECGHVANSHWRGPDGRIYLSCYICKPIDEPRGDYGFIRVRGTMLDGRMAVCRYYPHGGPHHKCPEPIASSYILDSFEYMGPGTRRSYCAVCGVAKPLHYVDSDVLAHFTKATQNKIANCTGFEPDETYCTYDRYYCGCGETD